jgi:hypothetical protein
MGLINYAFYILILKEEFSHKFSEQCRIGVHAERDITINCIRYLMSQISLNILKSTDLAGLDILYVWKMV